MIAGLYIHIPFCTQRCPYCSFAITVAKQRDWHGLLSALLAELDWAVAYSGCKTWSSIYLGGGTPSLAPAWFIEKLLSGVYRRCVVTDDIEVTIECNPQDLKTRDWLEACVDVGVNRISLGVQSFSDMGLKKLGRGQTCLDNDRALRLMQAFAGRVKYSLDLIYAIPGQTFADLAADLKQLSFWQPEHISAYMLNYEPQTAYFHWREQGRLTAVSECLEVEMYLAISKLLMGELGYAHYEVSSFAKPGYRAVHNSAYWRHVPYLGIGPGAHSYLGAGGGQLAQRWVGWLPLRRYLERWLGWQDKTEVPWKTHEYIDDLALYREYLLCRLRSDLGISERYCWGYNKHFHKKAEVWLERGCLAKVGDCWVSTPEGYLWANSMAADFDACALG
jgi:oxygen-independent coproporphyrinogen-3 oxidase